MGQFALSPHWTSLWLPTVHIWTPWLWEGQAQRSPSSMPGWHSQVRKYRLLSLLLVHTFSFDSLWEGCLWKSKFLTITGRRALFVPLRKSGQLKWRFCASRHVVLDLHSYTSRNNILSYQNAPRLKNRYVVTQTDSGKPAEVNSPSRENCNVVRLTTRTEYCTGRALPSPYHAAAWSPPSVNS